ncbi:methyl-CpG-binding domain-containing protein [Dionaea muscipula]
MASTSAPVRRKVPLSKPPPSLSQVTGPPPLQMITAAADTLKMQIVSSSASAGDFELPEGWIVEVRPRPPNSAIKADKYYYEPETGRRFRSLQSIKRYLNGEEGIMPLKKKSCPAGAFRPLQNVRNSKRIVFGGKILEMEELKHARETNIKAVVPSTPKRRLSSIIPDGWIVEEVPRKDGSRSDRYYIDPVNKLRFRSVLDVQRYFAGEEHGPKHNGLKSVDFPVRQQKSDSLKKSRTLRIFSSSSTNISSPPQRVKWVFNSLAEETWSPFIAENIIPDHVKELWAETFLLGMTGSKDPVPLLTMTETSSE